MTLSGLENPLESFINTGWWFTRQVGIITTSLSVPGGSVLQVQQVCFDDI